MLQNQCNRTPHPDSPCLASPAQGHWPTSLLRGHWPLSTCLSLPAPTQPDFCRLRVSQVQVWGHFFPGGTFRSHAQAHSAPALLLLLLLGFLGPPQPLRVPRVVDRATHPSKPPGICPAFLPSSQEGKVSSGRCLTKPEALDIAGYHCHTPPEVDPIPTRGQHCLLHSNLMPTPPPQALPHLCTGSASAPSFLCSPLTPHTPLSTSLRLHAEGNGNFLANTWWPTTPAQGGGLGGNPDFTGFC